MANTNDVIYRGAGDHIAQIFTVSDPLLKSSTVISEIPLEKEISVPSIDFRSHISSSPVPIKEILSNYLDSVSIVNLREAQLKDQWIMSLPHSTSDQYFKKDGLFMRKFQLKNYKWVGQIILPTDIAIKMIKKYHAQPLTRHVSTKNISRHLLNVFYIRNFTQLAQK